MPVPTRKPQPCRPTAGWDNPVDTNRTAGMRLQGVEQRFRVGVVVADPWPREGSQHTQLLKP
jgi:hypothetical protein